MQGQLSRRLLSADATSHCAILPWHRGPDAHPALSRVHGVRTAAPLVAKAEVKLLAPDEARDEVLVKELARIINGAYAVGEAGL
jgi:hypothetical protein